MYPYFCDITSQKNVTRTATTRCACADFCSVASQKILDYEAAECLTNFFHLENLLSINYSFFILVRVKVEHILHSSKNVVNTNIEKIVNILPQHFLHKENFNVMQQKSFGGHSLWFFNICKHISI